MRNFNANPTILFLQKTEQNWWYYATINRIGWKFSAFGNVTSRKVTVIGEITSPIYRTRSFNPWNYGVAWWCHEPANAGTGIEGPAQPRVAFLAVSCDIVRVLASRHHCARSPSWRKKQPSGLHCSLPDILVEELGPAVWFGLKWVLLLNCQPQKQKRSLPENSWGRNLQLGRWLALAEISGKHIFRPSGIGCFS